eukprot:scaffold14974_cov195-Amphora_coffeaeformis.AAC.30
MKGVFVSIGLLLFVGNNNNSLRRGVFKMLSIFLRFGGSGDKDRTHQQPAREEKKYGTQKRDPSKQQQQRTPAVKYYYIYVNDSRRSSYTPTGTVSVDPAGDHAPANTQDPSLSPGLISHERERRVQQ